MNPLRPARLWAIARRDLAQTLQGRRGLTLTAVTALLLLPAASVPIEPPTQPFEQPVVVVTGEVPDAVLALDGVVVAEGDWAHLVFRRDDAGRLVVQGPSIPTRVRRALDGDTPALTVERTIPDFPIPGRTALLALISASVLTGGISESIGGERSRKTLQALLAAAITRGELVVGKWLAWSGYAAVAAYLAATVAMLTGRAEPGWWLLPLPMVSAGTVALGLYLVRHTSDVVSGAAVSLRVLPALLTVTGLVSWYFADISPLAAAALPVGGALLASGSTWSGAAAPIVATLSTGLFCALLLARTAADLERPAAPRATWLRNAWQASWVTALAALCWWLPITSPLLWGAAGNQGLTDRLPTLPGVTAGALGLLAMVALYLGRTTQPRDAVGLTASPVFSWGLALVAGAVLTGLNTLSLWSPTDLPALALAASSRLQAAWTPTHIGVGLLALVAQELVFRGWLQRVVGPIGAGIAFVIVITPLDPLRGLPTAIVLHGLTRVARGGVGPAVLARVLALVATGLFWP